MCRISPYRALVTLLSLFSSFYSVQCLWPIPSTLQTGDHALVLSPDFDIQSGLSTTPADLSDAIVRTMAFLQHDKLQRLVVGRGASDSAAIKSARTLRRLSLLLDEGAVVRNISEEAVADIKKRSEEYVLSVPVDGTEAVVRANSTLGLLRGLTTFEQLWYEFDGQTYTLEAPISITDRPAYPYRGFMLDTARNFFPVSDIQRTLDAMSWVKLNIFYWHAVDSQSFPLEVAEFPELAEAGAYSESFIYSTQDVQDIVSYAAARGIDVVLELDTPGHTTAIGQSHPEHIACNQATPWSQFASEPPAGQLRLATPATVNFTTALISSVSEAFPSLLFSTGGDEVNLNCYTQDNITQSDLEASGMTLDQALSFFLQSLQSVLERSGKTPIVKEDMVLKHNVTLSNSTIVVVWISSQDAQAIAERNFRIIHQPSDYFYLDCGAGAWVGDDILGISWCDPFKTWQKSYSFDPLANLTAAQSELVLGGQVPLWTEQSGPQNLDSIAWPRAATTAEIFWTGATLPDGSARNVSLALPRLHDLRFRMVQRGIDAIPLQPEWCALRQGACDA